MNTRYRIAIALHIPLLIVLAMMLFAGCGGSSSGSGIKGNPTGRSLSGVLLDEQGTPFANISITEQSSGASTTTDENGSFVLEFSSEDEEPVELLLEAEEVSTTLALGSFASNERSIRIEAVIDREQNSAELTDISIIPETNTPSPTVDETPVQTATPQTTATQTSTTVTPTSTATSRPQATATATATATNPPSRTPQQTMTQNPPHNSTPSTTTTATATATATITVSPTPLPATPSPTATSDTVATTTPTAQPTATDVACETGGDITVKANIHDRVHGARFQNLCAGTYRVRYLDGAWETFNGQINCANTDGCTRGPDESTVGYMNIYGIASNNSEIVRLTGAWVGPNDSSVSIGTDFPPGTVEDRAGIDYAKQGTNTFYFVIDDGNVYPTAQDAEASSRNSRFRISDPGQIRFFVPDKSRDNNTGEFRLRVSRE